LPIAVPFTQPYFSSIFAPKPFVKSSNFLWVGKSMTRGRLPGKIRSLGLLSSLLFKTRKFSRDRSRLFCPVNISSTAFVFKEGDSAIEGDFWASILLSLEAVDLVASSLGFFSASSLVFDWTEGPSRFVLV